MGWGPRHIPDLSGQVSVVTGANSGLGLVVSRELARAGCRVVLACRDTARGDAAARSVRTAVPAADVPVRRLDLGDLSSIHAFAREYAAEHDGLDLLVNNAGVMAVPYRTTADGFEMQLGVNHLGHFALTGLLRGSLLARPSRVVTVTSTLHRLGRIDFADPHGRRRYRRWSAYGQSKLANLLFARELQRRAEAAQVPLASMAAHPGYAATNLQARGPRMAGNRLQERAVAVANRLIAQSDEMGALPILYAATVPGLPGGSFAGPDGPLEQRGHPRLVDFSAAAQDTATARRLWDLSAELTGVGFALATHAGPS